jgi:hypothetical protein
MDLSSREQLLLAQAVYEYGNDAWDKVCALLGTHPLLCEKGVDPHKFTPPNCSAWYQDLMAAEQLEPCVPYMLLCQLLILSSSEDGDKFHGISNLYALLGCLKLFQQPSSISYSPRHDLAYTQQQFAPRYKRANVASGIITRLSSTGSDVPRTLVTEIEQIRSGQWDERIRAEHNLPIESASLYLQT